MDNYPKISVIIPVYNVEKYLRKCLDSVINQTYTNLEIICVNDGSPDNSLAILKEYATKDERIIVIDKENGGVSSARNKGLEIATGEYISFIDSDDWLELNLYELAIAEYLKDSEIDIVTWSANVIDNRNASKYFINSQTNRHHYNLQGKHPVSKQIFNRVLAAPWANLFRMDFIKELKLSFVHYTLGEDVAFLSMYYLKVKNVCFISENLYNYVLQPNSLIEKFHSNNSAAEKALILRLSSFIEIIHFYKNYDNMLQFKNIIFTRLYNTLIYNLKLIDNIENIHPTIKLFIDNLGPYFYDNWNLASMKTGDFHKIPELNFPYFSIRKKWIQFYWYKNSPARFILKVCGIKISLKYQKILSIKNDGKGHKVLTLFGLKVKFSKNKKFKERFKHLIQNIFSVRNEMKNLDKYKVIRILGLKIKHNINLQRKIKLFAKRNNRFLNRPKKTTIKRLFLTTGSISLINNLAMIKQLNTSQVQDSLLILSNLENPKFFNTCKKIAQLHKFKKVFSFCQVNKNIFEYFIKNKLFDYDEIYFSNQFQFIDVVNRMYPNAKWIVTDEGCGGKVARYAHLNYDKVDEIITHNYLNKLDFFGLSSENMKKIQYIDIEIFKSIANKCEKLFPLDIKIGQEEKVIIFCGSWWEITHLPKDKYIELQDGLLQHLCNKGYKILFKPHPRDARNYVNNHNITILNTNLPLECYNLDAVATVSILSSTSLHSPYTNNLAGFSVYLLDKTNPKYDTKWLEPIVKKVMEEYTTPIEVLLSVNPQLYSKEDLKKILLSKCYHYLNTKPVLSQNKDIENFALKKGYIVDKKEDLICQ